MTDPMLAAAQDPLSWLLSNPKLLLLVVPTAIWLLNQILAATKTRAGARPAEAAAGADEAEAERPRQVQEEVRSAWQGDADPAEAERTRRVREEVRRKIAERRGERPPMQAAPPRIDRPARTEAEPEPAARAAVQPRMVQQAPVPVPPAARIPSSFPAAQSSAVAALYMELHDPSQVRRAIILREVLGPPVALR